MVVSTVVAQQRFEKTQHSAIICDVTPQLQVDDNTTITVEDNEITLFSVCAGIGSGQMAIERAGLHVKTISVCDTDPDCVELFKDAFPGVPVYGDMRFVITAM